MNEWDGTMENWLNQIYNIAAKRKFYHYYIRRDAWKYEMKLIFVRNRTEEIKSRQIECQWVY